MAVMYFLCFLWFCADPVIDPLGAEERNANLMGGLLPPGEVVHQVCHPAAVVVVAALLPAVKTQELHLDLGDTNGIPTTVAGFRIDGEVALDEVPPGLRREVIPTIRKLGSGPKTAPAPKGAGAADGWGNGRLTGLTEGSSGR